MNADKKRVPDIEDTILYFGDGDADYAIDFFMKARRRNGGYKSSIASADAVSGHGLLKLHHFDKEAPSFFKSLSAAVIDAAHRGGDFNFAFKAGLQFIAAPFHACYADDLGLLLVSMVEEADADGDSDSKRLYGVWLMSVRNWIAFRYPNSKLGDDHIEFLFENDFDLRESGELDRILDEGKCVDRAIVRI